VAPRYKRILLKLSGEALAGDRGYGIDNGVVDRVAAEIAGICRDGVETAIVIGGGNIFRGLSQSARGMSRTAADAIGMLGTVINSIAVAEAITRAGTRAVVMSANAVEKVTEVFTADKARRHLCAGAAVIIAGGTGNPFFTTDTAAALRCAETGGEILMKATKVDGVYDSDPVANPSARKFDRITHEEALRRNLKVMDSTAFSFCMDNAIPILVFKLLEKGNLRKAVEGKDIGTIVAKEA